MAPEGIAIFHRASSARQDGSATDPYPHKETNVSAPAGPSNLSNRNVVHVAEYLRMSKEHQRYSLENQSAAIRAYANERGMRVVRTYSDAGKSGRTFDGREALQQLITDVTAGESELEFSAVLVYDVSRWGRSQDADESAYYEFACRRAGIRVLYCAEPFEDDSSPMSALIKSIKRTMASEFGRELSVRVFTGQCRLVEKGYWQGAEAAYGLRRMLVNERGERKGVLHPGERKSLREDRTVLVPGPALEVAVVMRIFRRFALLKHSMRRIAAELNAEGIPGPGGRLWKPKRIRAILRNEAYIGNNVYNRRSRKLRSRIVINPETTWVRSKGAFAGIVDPEVFAEAQSMFAVRRRRSPDQLQS